MTRLRDSLTLPSRIRYLGWRLGLNGRQALKVRTKEGLSLILRPAPASDLDVANEVYIQQVYQPPKKVEQTQVLRIADLGANVGYSILWWLKLFPTAHVTAYEPHPVHCRQIREHLVTNQLTERVTLNETAAGVAAGRGSLSNNENCSSLVGTSTGIDVPVRDVFEDFADPRPDLMKIDIEGGEYDILDDPRFDSLRPSIIVLEWHRTADPRSGLTWVSQRLKSLGYEIIQGADFREFGMLWGFASD